MNVKKSSAELAALLRKHAGAIAPALFISAAFLLVVEHWQHLEVSDFALLILILAPAVQVLAHGPQRSRPSA